METSFVLALLTWVTNIVFFLSLVPQAILNFKLKTTRGISDFMLFSYFIGYITYNFYIFCLKLPFAYKITGPLSLLITLVMIFQRFFYAGTYKKDALLLTLYGINGIIALAVIPYAMHNAYVVGTISGWIQAFIWIPSGLPQIWQVYLTKSVLGFSFWSATLLFLGGCIDGLVTFWMGYPIQTVLNCFQGGIFYIVFCFQFWQYSSSSGANNAQS